MDVYWIKIDNIYLLKLKNKLMKFINVNIGMYGIKLINYYKKKIKKKKKILIVWFCYLVIL